MVFGVKQYDTSRGFGFEIDGRGKPLELARLGYWYVHASLELQSIGLISSYTSISVGKWSYTFKPTTCISYDLVTDYK